MTTVDNSASAAAPGPQPARPATSGPAGVIGYRAQSPDGTGNTYLYGENCRDCDQTYDPHYRTGVPCREAYAHARRTVQNWRDHGHTANAVPVHAAS